MTLADFSDLHVLSSCDLIRFKKEDEDTFSLLLVADNEEEDEESHDEEEEEEDDHDNLNGHLYKLTFLGVSHLSIEGGEQDSYRLLKLETKEKTLSLEYEGTSYTGINEDVKISFAYQSFSVEDKGKIPGPEI